MDKIEPKLDQILETLAQARGGWKTLMLVAGVASLLGALVAKVVAFIKLE
ncbi:hypothetical protein [Candidatus Hakubella thermalkaliphila]|nr:hypothetical protein [Candidatus Hakubella thermalkaliphila]